MGLFDSTTSTTPSDAGLFAITDAYGRAANAANTPRTPYSGQLVAPLTPGQQTSISQLENAYGLAQPYIDAGSAQLGNAAGSLGNVSNFLQSGSGFGAQSAQALGAIQPYLNQETGALGQAGNYFSQAAGYAAPVQFSQQALGQYLNPYTQDVINTTMQQARQNDAAQMAGLVSNSIGSGAYGGDRNGIAVGTIAGQQALANNSTVAGLNQANYGQAVTQFNQNQANRFQAAGLLGNLGTGSLQQAAGYGSQATTMGQTAQQYGALGNLYNTLGQTQLGTGTAQGNLGALSGYLGGLSQQNAISGASAGLQGSTVQQQLQQAIDQARYGQFTQGQAYPFQTAGFLANIVNGLAAQTGGTTTNEGSILSSLVGAGTAAFGAAGLSGGLSSLSSILPNISNLGAGNKDGGRVGFAKGGSVGLGALVHALPVAGLGGVSIMRPMHGPAPVTPHVIRRLARPHFDVGGQIFNPTDGGIPGASGGALVDLATNPAWGTLRMSGAAPRFPAPPRQSSGLGGTGMGASGLAASPLPPQASVPSDSSASTLTDSSGGLSKNAWMGILGAGLGMMGGTSGNGFANVGSGGLEGLKVFMGLNQQDRQNQLAQQEMGFKGKQLAISQQEVDQAAQKIDQAAKFHSDEMSNTSAQIANQTAQTQSEIQSRKFDNAIKAQTITPAGILQRDPESPSAPPRLVTWDQLNGSPAPDASAPTAPSSATGAPVPAPGPVPSNPATSPPVVTQSVSPLQGTTDIPQRIPVNAQRVNPKFEEVLQDNTKSALVAAKTSADAARSTQLSLAQMGDAMATLPQSGWLAQGPGQQQRAQVAGQINTALRGLGVSEDNLINPTAVASSEELKKLTTRMGFDLAKSLGGREPGFIVNQAVASVPSTENSPMGAQRLMAGLAATAQRQIDYNSFIQKWAAKTGGDITGADDYFNKVNPPQSYAAKAVISTIPTPYIARLRQTAADNPAAAQFFDQRFGAGTSKLVLGAGPQQ